MTQPPTSKSPTPFHVMTKPIGPLCNLDCSYCFYLEKAKLYPETNDWRMSDEVLERYIADYIAAQPGDEVQFAWQGGEPTLLGVDYFRKVVELQKRYANGKVIANALQTNGTKIDDAWGKFLHDNQFLVGLSIDGPRDLHDAYRVDKGQKPTFDRVMNGLETLKKHNVEFNTLTVVNRKNADEPIRVYEFLRETGSRFIQFIPLVERTPEPGSTHGLDLAEPPSAQADSSPTPRVTSWSLLPEQYGEFLVSIFDTWVRRDVGELFVQLFDVALGNWAGLGGGLCVFSETCGSGLAIEHNGDVFSCDHYVYPKYKLGNVMTQSLGDMAASPEQKKFGREKASTLPRYCRECDVRFACHGECPKHRFLTTPDGEPGLNYLCAAYKRFFHHVAPYMDTMVNLLRQGRPPAFVMNMAEEISRRQTNQASGAARTP